MVPENTDAALTAYALNELPPDEAAAVAARLATDPAAQRAVDEARVMAAHLTAFYATDDGDPSVAAPAQLGYASAGRRRWRTTAVALAAAAAVAVGVAGVYVAVSVRRMPIYSYAGPVMPPAVAAPATQPQVVWDVPSGGGGGVVSKNSFGGRAGLETAGDVKVAERARAALAGVDPSLPRKNRHLNLDVDGLQDEADVLKGGADKAVSGASPVTRSRAASPVDGADAVLLPSDEPGVNVNTGSAAGGRTNEREVTPTADRESRRYGETESYAHPPEAGFLSPAAAPLSTFATNVDTASYANVRRFVEQQGQLPPADAVRVEELINAFTYRPIGPTGDEAVGVGAEVAGCPWAEGHELVRVAVDARPLVPGHRPAANLVFLIDVSGSMADPGKLDLLKAALPKLVAHLSADDRVSIVTYAGQAQTNLPATACDDGDPLPPEVAARAKALIDQGRPDEAAALLGHRGPSGKQRVLDAIAALHADGSTNGGDGIKLAYRAATASFVKGGVNRVILSTDGDFNVGVTDPRQLTTLIEHEADTGVYLTVLGVGMGNLKDATMEQLAAHGRGNYAYLDTAAEAERVLSREADATLVTVARDVKVQVEFNPATVAGYRLIGYDDRHLPPAAFNDDAKRAGEMGAGQAVTALYEVVPVGATPAVDPLKYGQSAAATSPASRPAASELMTVKVRYQPPAGGASRKVEVPVAVPPPRAREGSDVRFAAAVAEFGLALRHSPYAGSATLADAAARAAEAVGEDADGSRRAFVQLARRAAELARP